MNQSDQAAIDGTNLVRERREKLGDNGVEVDDYVAEARIPLLSEEPTIFESMKARLKFWLLKRKITSAHGFDQVDLKEYQDLGREVVDLFFQEGLDGDMVTWLMMNMRSFKPDLHREIFLRIYRERPRCMNGIGRFLDDFQGLDGECALLLLNSQKENNSLEDYVIKRIFNFQFVPGAEVNYLVVMELFDAGPILNVILKLGVFQLDRAQVIRLITNLKERGFGRIVLRMLNLWEKQGSKKVPTIPYLEDFKKLLK